MKLDRKQSSIHLPWVLLAAIATVLLIGWYAYASFQARRLLGGGSAPGLACGIVASLIIAFEMLLWPRKYFRRLRLIAARYWMAAHIWLGLASLPLAVVHTGFHFGGLLPQILIWLFVLTIVSGVYGLILQNVIPKVSLRLLPAETIYSEIDYVSERNVQDVRQALSATCGPRREESDEGSNQSSSVKDDEPAVPKRTAVVVGAIREVGLVRGRTIHTRNIVTDARDREILWNAFDQVEPFLRVGKRAGGPLRQPAEARQWFSDLRRACGENSEPVIATMEQYYLQRSQFDLQRTLHRWLHVWLPVHIGLSVAVCTLLVVHVLTALKFW